MISYAFRMISNGFSMISYDFQLLFVQIIQVLRVPKATRKRWENSFENTQRSWMAAAASGWLAWLGWLALPCGASRANSREHDDMPRP